MNMKIGNESSSSRAIGHGIMDFMTLGLWEVVGTPIEGFQGNTRMLYITYDKNDKILKLSGSAPKKTF